MSEQKQSEQKNFKNMTKEQLGREFNKLLSSKDQNKTKKSKKEERK